MIERLRNRLQPLLNIVAKPFTVFHPNVLSFGLFIVAIPGFYFYSIGSSIGGSLFILAAMFDGIDGTVAKLTGKTSKFGGILDATLDRLFEGLLFMFIGMGNLVSWPILFTVFNLSVCISFIKSKAETMVGESKVGKNKFSVGFAQRGDRLLIVFLGSLLNGFFTNNNNEILTYAMCLLLAMSAITLIWRGIVIYQVVDELERGEKKIETRK
jgi:archaetidylinositol phosphate synthase